MRIEFTIRYGCSDNCNHRQLAQYHCNGSNESRQGSICEKPMVHQISEGLAEIKVQNETKSIFQDGSQRISSIAYQKARELYQAGAIGQINSIEASFNRQSALGAWQYTIPPDASKQTVDWEEFQKHEKNKHAYENNRFFRWRNYREYGTGVAGDLFVHLLSGIHFITGSKGPDKVYALGGTYNWKDGRNVPDVMSAVVEYFHSALPAMTAIFRIKSFIGILKA